MSHILKNGKPIGIGRNVKVTPVPCDLREKRREHLTGEVDDTLIRVDSRELLSRAKSDPVSFTYALWRFFKEDSATATERLCDLAIDQESVHVLKTLEIMMFEASPRINAFCMSYIISQLSGYIDSNPSKVKRAVKMMMKADFLSSIRLMKGMYESSPRVTKEIARKLMGSVQYGLLKTIITPIIRPRR